MKQSKKAEKEVEEYHLLQDAAATDAAIECKDDFEPIKRAHKKGFYNGALFQKKRQRKFITNVKAFMRKKYQTVLDLIHDGKLDEAKYEWEVFNALVKSGEDEKVDLKQVVTGELIAELLARSQDWDVEEDYANIYRMAEEFEGSERMTLEDKIKDELFEEQRDKFTIAELQQILNR